MNRLILLFLALFLCQLTLFAQSDDKRLEVSLGFVTANAKSLEVSDFSSFAGIPGGQLSTNFQATPDELKNGFRQAFGHPKTAFGFNVSGSYYLNDKFALVADFSAVTRKSDRQSPNNPIFFEDLSRSRRTQYTLLGGLQWKYRKRRVEPFVRGMAGFVRAVNRTTLSISNVGNPGSSTESFRLQNDYTALALSVGGGIDVRINRHTAIRIIQFDYIPIFAGDRAAQLTAPGTGSGNRVDLGLTRVDNSFGRGFRVGVGVVFR